MEKKEERKISRYDTDKMIDFVKLQKEEPDLFDELCEDYPAESNTTVIFNVKG